MLQKPINRRTLLKALLATGGGLTASAFLPARWTKPLVKTGVLPVHAQTSSPRYLSAGAAIGNDTDNGTFTLTNIWAFVSSTPLDGSSSHAPSRIDNGVGGVPVTLSFTNNSNINCATLPYTFTTPSTGSTIGHIDFPDQTFTNAPSEWSLTLIFTSSGCTYSPVSIPFHQTPQ